MCGSSDVVGLPPFPKPILLGRTDGNCSSRTSGEPHVLHPNLDRFLVWSSKPVLNDVILLVVRSTNDECILEGFHGRDLMAVVGFLGCLAVFLRFFFLTFFQSPWLTSSEDRSQLVFCMQS